MDTKRYIPATKLPASQAKAVVDTDVTSMLSRTLEILDREIANLNSESCNRKLSKDSATALISYVKLLNELQTKEKELLEEMNETELKGLAERAREENKGK